MLMILINPHSRKLNESMTDRLIDRSVSDWDEGIRVIWRKRLYYVVVDRGEKRLWHAVGD